MSSLNPFFHRSKGSGKLTRDISHFFSQRKSRWTHSLKVSASKTGGSQEAEWGQIFRRNGTIRTGRRGGGKMAIRERGGTVFWGPTPCQHQTCRLKSKNVEKGGEWGLRVDQERYKDNYLNNTRL